MGSGSWTTDSFRSYSCTKGMSVSTDGLLSGDYSNQEMFKAETMDPVLDPKDAVRECRDTEEHPNTIPVILALDVTGSMGETAVEIAKKLNVIMTKLYDKVSDIEFMIMGIGDLECDHYPIQASQFESDIRIAEQLDKLYFEFGGGGNSYESYTAAWYFASRHTKLDCLKRGRKGIIITMGDEMLNPCLPKIGKYAGLAMVTGDNLQENVINTRDLYDEVSQDFNIYHLDVHHRSRWNDEEIEKSFKRYLDDSHFRRVSIDNITDEIADIIINEASINSTTEEVVSSTNIKNENKTYTSGMTEITW